MILTIVTSSKAQIPTNGLVAWYPFTGNAIDSSGNGNNGTVNGATLTTDRFGKTNSAYSFNGIDNYIKVLNSVTLNPSSVSISGWYLTNNLPSNASDSCRTIISKWWQQQGSCNNYHDSYLVTLTYWKNSPKICAASPLYPGTDFYSNSVISKGNWSHFVYTHDSLLGGKFYLNGIPLISNNINGAICSSLESLLIGADNNGGTLWRYFNGKLDDIRIYNRALDSSEIQQLYHEGGYTGNTLPVDLQNIFAIQKGNILTVNWHTSSELNTSHFIIQHSGDGSSFTDIGTVKAVGNGANSYSFADTHPTKGANYYRLKVLIKME